MSTNCIKQPSECEVYLVLKHNKYYKSYRTAGHARLGINHACKCEWDSKNKKYIYDKSPFRIIMCFGQKEINLEE